MPIENMKKHAGVLLNTGVRVAVVFRKLPADEKHCLIVETERLTDMYHDTLMQALVSKESSETNDFYEVLSRRSFPNGKNCLEALHREGFLRKESITNISMIPLPGHNIPLELINATIDNKIEEYKAHSADRVMPAAIAEVEKGKDPKDVAIELLAKAEELQIKAVTLREEAYILDPSLKPGSRRGKAPDPTKGRDVINAIQRDQRKRAREKKAADALVESELEKKARLLEEELTALKANVQAAV